MRKSGAKRVRKRYGRGRVSQIRHAPFADCRD
jgi:hypothetical protein